MIYCNLPGDNTLSQVFSEDEVQNSVSNRCRMEVMAIELMTIDVTDNVPASPTSAQPDTSNLEGEMDHLKRLLRSHDVVDRFRQGLFQHHFFGLIMRYLESERFDLGLTRSLRKIFQRESAKYASQGQLL